MEILKQHSLLPHNTFAIDAKADWWIGYDSAEDLQTLARDEYFASQPYLLIGSGSNLLFTTDYHGAVLSSRITDIAYYSAEQSALTHPGQQHVRVGSGVVWDDFVARMLDEGLYGLENLSLIPGTIGASAVQNIGAYGSEAAQYIVAVEAVDLSTGILHHIPASLCDYSYRHSIFKEQPYRSFAITHVHFLLSTEPTCQLGYASLAKAFEGKTDYPTPHEIREEVIRIRQGKLPAPELIPNAGSFFMNPVVPQEIYDRLAAEYDTPVPHYSVAQEGYVKLSAAWLIDQSGLKGYRSGQVGVYDKQPLVLVNYGGASGADLVTLSRHVQKTVLNRFGIQLQPEVLFID